MVALASNKTCLVINFYLQSAYQIFVCKNAYKIQHFNVHVQLYLCYLSSLLVINGTLFKRQLVCESDLVGYLQCDNADEKLAIIDVMYGRLSTDVCQSGDYQSNVRCVSTKGLKHLQQCFDKNVCIFYFDDDLDDPCPGVEKYMDIVYDCLK